MFLKKLSLLVLVVLMVLSVKLCAMCQELAPPADLSVVDLSTLSPEDVIKLQNPEAIGKSVFYAPADYEFNFKIAVTGDVLKSADENYIKVKFAKPVYCYFSLTEGPVFSVDGKVWKRGGELFTGSFSFGFEAKKEDEGRPAGSFVFDLNVRGEK